MEIFSVDWRSFYSVRRRRTLARSGLAGECRRTRLRGQESARLYTTYLLYPATLHIYIRAASFPFRISGLAKCRPQRNTYRMHQTRRSPLAASTPSHPVSSLFISISLCFIDRLCAFYLASRFAHGMCPWYIPQSHPTKYKRTGIPLHMPNFYLSLFSRSSTLHRTRAGYGSLKSSFLVSRIIKITRRYRPTQFSSFCMLEILIYNEIKKYILR